MIITANPNIILLLLTECRTGLHKMAGVPQQMGYSSWRLPGPSSISTEAAYLCESTKMRKHQSVRARKQLQYSKDVDICRAHTSYFWGNVEIRNSRGGEVRTDAEITSRHHMSVPSAQLLTPSRHYCYTFRLWQFDTLYVHQYVVTVPVPRCYSASAALLQSQRHIVTEPAPHCYRASATLLQCQCHIVRHMCHETINFKMYRVLH